jgi:hypothetical protein
MDEAVISLQQAYGRRTIMRRHHVLPPDGTADDRVRYLAQLRELNDQFLDRASAITVPTAAELPRTELLDTTRAATTLMNQFISDPTGDFDSLAAQLDDLERPLVSAFLDVIRTIDPSAVATAERHTTND